MIHVREIDHVVLRCADLDRMLAFYRDVLCCPLESSQPGLLQLRAGRSLVDLVPTTGRVAGHNMDHFCLRVDPFDAVAIATPVHTHAPLGVAALRSGKHVLIEKPMAASVREAEDLVAAARGEHLDHRE